MKNIPQDILKHKPKSSTIEEKNGVYYLYKVSSKRVPGIKYPVSTKKYVGTITSEGIKYGRTKIDLKEILVYEYGYTCFIVQKCKTINRIRTNYKDQADDLIKEIMIELSPNTYLLNNQNPRKNFPKTTYWLNEITKELSELNVDIEPLKYVYKVIEGTTKIISKLDDIQRDIIKKWGLNL